MLSRTFTTEKQWGWLRVRYWLLVLCVLSIFFVWTQIFLLKPTTEECDQGLRWSEWGPFSFCEKTPSGECIRGRFRSCLCKGEVSTKLPSSKCSDTLGNSNLHWEYCKESECANSVSKPSEITASNSARIPISVQVPGAPPPHQKLYMMEIPAYGPNNQYSGMKEAMIITKTAGRIFARPDFWPHMEWGKDNTKKFDTTFDSTNMNEYAPTVSMEEFAKECNGTINMMVWLRWKRSYWVSLLENYFAPYNLKYKDEWLVPETYEREEQPFRSFDDIKSFFSKYTDRKCIALVIPFRNLWFDDPERLHVAKYVHHAPNIRQLATDAIKEMQVSSNNLMSYHWRFGEDSCAVYKAPGKDFCYGTSIFTWTKIEDAIFVLSEVIKESGIRHLYMAIATHFNPVQMFEKLQAGLSQINVTISRSGDIKVLKDIKDPYILSLVEQEICAQSKVFIASTDSTWSDFIVDFVHANDLPHVVHDFTSLLKKHKKEMVEMNLMVERKKANQ